MRIRIGDMSKMLGIVPSTLRYYEKIGVVSPEVDAATKYRYYHVKDLVWLILCRRLLKTGFSLSQAVSMVYEMPYDQALSRLETRHEQSLRQVREAMLLEKHIGQTRATWEEARGMVGRCVLWFRPELLRLDFQGEELFFDHQRLALATAWLERMPYVYLQQMVAPDEMLSGTGGLDHIWGLAIERELARRTGIEENPLLRRVGEAQCVRTAFYMQIRGPLYPRYYAHALDFIKRHRFRISANAETQVISFAGDAKERQALLLMDIPVSEEDD